MAPDLLGARDVHHAYGTRGVLCGIDLSVRPGTLAGIVGENGTGNPTQ